MSQASPDQKGKIRPKKNGLADSLKNDSNPIRKTLKSSQKALNKENLSIKKGPLEKSAVVFEPKSQSLITKKKNSDDLLQFNIYKTRSPESFLDKGSRTNILAEKYDSQNVAIKPKNNKSLNEPKNFVIGSLSKKKSDGLISSNMFMQKYQSFIKNGTIANSASSSKMNPYFLFKSRAK